MTTERLYYTDAYTTSFAARIVERVHRKDRLAVVLDRTLFYPVSGGQPADWGRINQTAVTDVEIRASDGAILHWLKQDDVWADDITAEIDWSRRFDHMQQHTGQHILSQAFIQIARAETVGFHLSDNTLTIDLHTHALTASQIQDTEQLANEIIWQNRPIHIRFVTAEQAAALPLRKLPPVEKGRLRLIEIEEFDLTACGGTHVHQTGAVGQIKIIRLERRGDQLRVHFVCGQRALWDYRHKNSIVNQLTANLTTSSSEIIPAITKMQDDLKEAVRTVRKQRDIVLQTEALSLYDHATVKGKTRVIAHVFTDRDPGDLRQISSFLAQKPHTVALLALSGEKSAFFFSRAEDAPGEMDKLLKSTMQLLDGGGGGGTAVQAQGGGAPATPERLQQALERTVRLLLGQIRG